MMNEIEIYQTRDKQTQIEVKFDGETVWLSLNQLADLFGRDKSVISRHLANIYNERELQKRATVAKNATVQTEAGRKVSRRIEYYNLDAIISVGYRGELKINDNGLVALALLVAQSDPADKELMVSLINNR